MRVARLAILAAFLIGPLCSAADSGRFHADASTDTRELIREARALARTHGDRIWPGFSAAPFGILLIDGDTERLFCHERVPEGFDEHENDPILGCTSSSRPASFPAGMFASFPAVDGIPTIVAGNPAATGKSPTEWILLVLHEHFHQLQYSQPGYYSGTLALGLDGGDETGLWMLNYPFPYANAAVASRIKAMANALITALEARNTDAFHDAAIDYWAAREAARESVSAADWRYLELQFWQEGVARWTEAAIARLSADFADAAVAADATLMRELQALDAAEYGRSIVYPLGAGEAALLEAAGTDWRSRYWSEPFSLGQHFQSLIDGGEFGRFN